MRSLGLSDSLTSTGTASPPLGSASTLESGSPLIFAGLPFPDLELAKVNNQLFNVSPGSRYDACRAHSVGGSSNKRIKKAFNAAGLHARAFCQMYA